MCDALQRCRDVVYPRVVLFTPLHLSQHSMDVTWTLAHGSPSKPPWICISGEDEGMRSNSMNWKVKKEGIAIIRKFPPSCCWVLQHRETAAHLLTANTKQGTAKPELVSPGPWHTLMLSEILTWLYLGLSVAEQTHLEVWGVRGICNLLF